MLYRRSDVPGDDNPGWRCILHSELLILAVCGCAGTRESKKRWLTFADSHLGEPSIRRCLPSDRRLFFNRRRQHDSITTFLFG